VIAALIALAFPILLLIAAAKDAMTMTIPNWVSLSLMGGFFIIAPLTLGLDMPGLQAIGGHVLVAGSVLAVCFGMFALNWIGGGDAKLFAATALWLGLGALPEFLMWTAFVGGGLSLGLLLARKAALLAPLTFGNGMMARLLTVGGDVPYGLAIAAGGLLAYPGSAVFLSAVG